MISCESLSKNFSSIKAVDNISFRVDKGEVLGFLGPNGAGKSTTMKIITGFLSPSSGTAKIDNLNIVDNSKKIRSLIGYLPENAPLYGEMSVYEFLRFISDVRGLSKSERKNALKKSVELTSLESVLSQKIETLSKGFKRRVGLAQAILHDPKVLILDEPTDGLDPNQKYEVQKLINEMAREGEKCIVLSTHILEEVEKVCSRAIIISKGKIVADDTPSNLKSRSKLAGSFLLKVKKEAGEKVFNKISNLTGFEDIAENLSKEEQRSSTSKIIRFKFEKEGTSGMVEIVNRLDIYKNEIEHISLEDGRLDHVFREITK